MAGLGVLGASVRSVLTDQAKGWLTHVVNATEELACEFRKPARAPDQQRPVILLARFEDDTNDEMWHRIIKILYDETDFDVVPSCIRFETTTYASIDDARMQFLKAMAPHITAAGADMLLFGTVYSSGKVWASNSLGGCKWHESQEVDLDAPGAPAAVSFLSRSSLLRVIVGGLIAACERPQDSDWSVVADKVDMVSKYIENRRTLFTAEDYDQAQLYIYSLSFSRYYNSGEETWFEQAKRSADAVIERAASAKDSGLAAFWRGQLAWVYWVKFQKTNSREAWSSRSHIFTRFEAAALRIGRAFCPVKRQLKLP